MAEAAPDAGPAALDATRIDGADAPLREQWYYAMPSHLLRAGKMVAKTLMGEPILFARKTDGTVFALLDLCPHRGIPLRFGRFDGKEVACAYHGWRFDGAGRCAAIPSLVEGQDMEVARIRTRTYPVHEAQGNLWIFFGEDPAAAPPPPLIPDIGDRVPGLIERVALAGDMDNAVIGLMDPAHGPFVHQSWYWRGAASIHAKAKAYAPSDHGFTMVRHAPSSNSKAYRLLGGKPETEIIFRLPGVRIEHIRIGRHAVVNFTAVTPIADGRTEITNALYWTNPWLTLLWPAMKLFAHRFIRQDRDIMAKQTLGLAHRPSLMLINDADTPAKWYFRLKREALRARAEGRPFENPVTPRVLRWRS